jgi:hypothetical protein
MLLELAATCSGKLNEPMSPRPPRGFASILTGVFLLMNAEAGLACTMKEPAYRASMMSDLRNLVTAQSAYAAEHENRYAPDRAALGDSYRTSSGVTVTAELTATGWKALATHMSTSNTCTIEVHAAAPGDKSVNPVCAKTGREGLDMTTTSRAVLLAIAFGLVGLGMVRFFRGRGAVIQAILVIVGITLAIATFHPPAIGCGGQIGGAISAAFVVGVVIGVPLIILNALVGIGRRIKPARTN